MGNLYTQFVRVRDERIEILSQLKQAWNTTPLDMNLIKDLQRRLDKIKREKSPKRKKWTGQYG